MGGGGARVRRAFACACIAMLVPLLIGTGQWTAVAAPHAAHGRVRVQVLIFDPVVHDNGGQRLTRTIPGWNNPDELTASVISNLAQVSGGDASYEVVDHQVIDE